MRHDEADGLAAGHVLTWRGGDVELLATHRERDGFPGLQAVNARPGCEVLRAVYGSKDVAAIEESSAEVVEVINVVFVAQEHSIDRWKLFEMQAGVVVNGKCDEAKIKSTASWREEGVSEQVDSVELKNGSCSADMSD